MTGKYTSGCDICTKVSGFLYLFWASCEPQAAYSLLSFYFFFGSLLPVVSANLPSVMLWYVNFANLSVYHSLLFSIFSVSFLDYRTLISLFWILSTSSRSVHFHPKSIRSFRCLPLPSSERMLFPAQLWCPVSSSLLWTLRSLVSTLRS